MRKALNDNPVVQAAAIGVLALVIAVFLLTRAGGPQPEPATEAPTSSAGTATTVVNGTATPPDPAADPAAMTADPAAMTAAPVTDGAPFKAGPGLPAKVVDAYGGGQAVALLIVNDRAIDDRDLAQSVASVGSRADVAVFVTDVKDVADYSRIAEGVKLNRTPALVMIRPKRLTDGTMPSAAVLYGFRGPASVQQAFDDALYSGPNALPYYP